MSAGLQVISTNVPEMRRYPDHCIVAESYEAFEAGVESALANDSFDARRLRSAAMRDQTWERKVAELGTTVMQIRAQGLRDTGARV